MSQLLLALGASIPEYARVPMILGPDGAKVSQRHGGVSVLQYEEGGYPPDALSFPICARGCAVSASTATTRSAEIDPKAARA